MRRVWFMLAALGLGAASCQGGLAGGGGGGVAGVPQEAEGPGPLPAGDVGAQELPFLSPNIIRTASLEVLVDRDGFSAAVDRATAVAAAHGGFIVESSVEGEEARSGSMVLRIPAERFDAALTELRHLGRIREERIASQDVGAEFVDLEARRRNLMTQERVMLDLMGDAGTVAATIQIQHELEDIQLEIERIEGRLRFLEDQTALGTITLHLVEEGVAPAEAPGILEDAWNAATEGFLRVLAAVVVAVGYLAPFGLAAGATLLVWLRTRRRARPAPES